MSLSPMRFRAAILVEFEAEDFRVAGQQQTAIEEVFHQLRARFPHASLAVNQRRFARGPGREAPSGRPERRRRVAAYDD